MDAYAVDLHVHTMCSSDYKGKKKGESIYNIIKQAYDNQVDMIAISDHNTVEGYRKYLGERNSVLQLHKLLKERGDIDGTSRKKVEDERHVFTAVKVLMGIEVKVNPGIHYVIVFNDKINPDDVDNFFVDLSEGAFVDGLGSSDFMFRSDSHNLFEKLKNKFDDDFLLYAPHADSSCGLMECLKECKTLRNELLSCDVLTALGINRQDTKDYVVGNLFKDIGQKRKRPLHFVLDSDYHGAVGDRIGNGCFFVEKKYGRPGFETLKSRFRDKNDLSNFLDVAKQEYEFYIKGKFKVKMNLPAQGEVSAEIEEELCKTACAILNAEDGIIEFDVDVSGIEDPKQFISDRIKKFVELIDSRTGSSPGSIVVASFPISKGRNAVLFTFKECTKLALYNNICYIFSGDNSVVPAKANQVESVVAKKMFMMYGRDKESSVLEITHEAGKVKNSLLCFSIAYKIEDKLLSRKFAELEYGKIKRLDKEMDKKVSENDNGVADGDSILLPRNKIDNVKCGRYVSNYFRFSTPMYRSTELGADLSKEIVLKKDSLLVLPNGASMLAQREACCLSELPYVSLEMSEGYNPYSVLAYLKSSFVQWFVSKVTNYDSIFDYIVEFGVEGFPVIEMINKSNEIGSFANNIIVDEMKFLKEADKLVAARKSVKMPDLTRSHNESVISALVDIDKKIFAFLGLSRVEIRQVYSDLYDMKVFEYGVIDNFGGYYKKES
jgi:hypothetical protein